MANGNMSDLGDFTIGMNVNEMERYSNDLRIEILDNVSTVLEDVSGIQAAMNGAWQGEARRAWERDFNRQIRAVQNDLRREYRNVDARLRDLAGFYRRVDRNMYQ